MNRPRRLPGPRPVLWAGAMAVALLLWGQPLTGQQVGLGGSHASNPGGYLPSGPGVHGWASYDLVGFIRLQGSVAREWGRNTEFRNFCGTISAEGPPPTDCVEEDVRFFNTTTSGEVSVLFLTPEWLRIRAGAGRGLPGGATTSTPGRRGSAPVGW